MFMLGQEALPAAWVEVMPVGFRTGGLIHRPAPLDHIVPDRAERDL